MYKTKPKKYRISKSGFSKKVRDRKGKKYLSAKNRKYLRLAFVGAFLGLSIVAFWMGYRVLSVGTLLSSIALLFGLVVPVHPFFLAFLGLSVSLAASFFETLNHYIN